MAFLDDTVGLPKLWAKIKALLSTNVESLNTEIAKKANSADLATVATSGAYGDLTGRPTVDASVKSGSANAVTGGAVYTELGKKANLASPTLTGTPKAPTAAAGNNTTQIATTAFVQSEINSKIAASDAMIYKGTIGASGATVTALPNTTAKIGWTYKCIDATITVNGTKCEVGDMIICLTDGSSSTAATWTVVQANIDGAVTGPASSTANHVATFNGATGKVIKDSGFTIGKSVPADAKFTDTTYTNMGAATASAAGKAGLVPAPGAGKQASFLRGDGTWVVPTNTTYNDMKGATTSAAGTHGLAPAPAAGAANRYLRSDGTWAVPPDTKYSAITEAKINEICV